MDLPSIDEQKAESALDRSTLCLPDYTRDSILHGGDDGYEAVLQHYFQTVESTTAERLIKLKTRLAAADTEGFWKELMEEMCSITGSQCGFVAKRILIDDENTAVEMPPLGEPGSCLMGVAFYLNDGKQVDKLYRDFRYHAYGAPCAYMKHDKVFIIPDRMTDFIPNNPNTLPWKQSEAYIGVPLFAEGKCFAHFGMIWSDEGAAKRNLTWGYIELFMHSLEDMITERLLGGKGFAKQPKSSASRIIPLDAITVSQSLKPYARSLSHELRTPMQGVVGMLDIMHSTVMDAIDSERSEVVRKIFEELRLNIELVQDSSKRAVEAADNVVHAYDLNMQMPETPFETDDEAVERASQVDVQSSPRPTVSDRGSSPNEHKRPREKVDFHPGPPMKRLAAVTAGELRRTYPAVSTPPPVAHNRDVVEINGRLIVTPGSTSAMSVLPTELLSAVLSPAHRRITTRTFMHGIVRESIKGLHPVHTSSKPTAVGGEIRVKLESPRGDISDLCVEMKFDTDVPENIYSEEQHLKFSLQKVIDNAIKFTTNGVVTISVNMARSSQVMEIRVIDTGCGITEESKLYLFKPHFQEDASISRARDGLGLSLFNAKACVRKSLGGDMVLERSATSGPNKGSEFLIRIPLAAPPDSTRPDTPLVGTLTPARLGSHPPSPMVSVKNSLPTPVTAIDITARPDTSPSVVRSNKRPGTFNRELANDVPLTFLIAEDNHINRNILVGYLKKLGYSPDNIHLAFDGVEAVAEYEKSLKRPSAQRINAILMDLWMPNMDGYEATEKILKMAKGYGENLAVMAVTADITSESMERARDCGMKGFISKPYKVLDIENLIIQHFGKTF